MSQKQVIEIRLVSLACTSRGPATANYIRGKCFLIQSGNLISTALRTIKNHHATQVCPAAIIEQRNPTQSRSKYLHVVVTAAIINSLIELRLKDHPVRSLSNVSYLRAKRKQISMIPIRIPKLPRSDCRQPW